MPKLCAEAVLDDICDFANDNTEEQVVVSGSAAAVKRAIEIAKGKGAKRAILLPVSAPFHCSLMAPAASVMTDALESVDINMPSVSVVANVTATSVSDVREIRRLLVEQVTSRVRWRDSMYAMNTLGVKHLTEVGYGKVLSGMARRINPGFSCANLSSPREIEAFLSA